MSVELKVWPQVDFVKVILFMYGIYFVHSHGRYVPTHLHMMVFELVKNSLRAVQERFMDEDKIAPPIRIIVADGSEDVTIKVWSLEKCYL